MVVPVYQVKSVALSAASNGRYLVQADGEVSTGGYTNPMLVSRGGIVDSDGNLDYDFMAEPPPPHTMVTQAFQGLNASVYFGGPGTSVKGLRQVRVFAKEGAVVAAFPPNAGS